MGLRFASFPLKMWFVILWFNGLLRLTRNIRNKAGGKKAEGRERKLRSQYCSGLWTNKVRSRLGIWCFLIGFQVNINVWYRDIKPNVGAGLGTKLMEPPITFLQNPPWPNLSPNQKPNVGAGFVVGLYHFRLGSHCQNILKPLYCRTARMSI